MTTTPDELYDAVESFVMRLMNLAASDGIDAMVDLDLSFSQARMLFLLAKTGEPQPIHLIARGIGLSDAAAGRNVEQLLKLGVVERRESPDDRRVKLVSLTATGETFVMSHMDAKREAIRSFARALPDDQRDTLHSALSDILVGTALAPRQLQENHL